LAKALHLLEEQVLVAVAQAVLQVEDVLVGQHKVVLVV
jgi:hypothetical protein